MKSLLLMVSIVTFSVYAEEELKKVDYANETSDAKSPSMPPESTLTPEQSKQLMEDIEKVKKNQAEAQKMLEELDREE
jgi:hypothetical protein